MLFMQTYIEIEGAREHNLKNVHLKVPHYALTVFTGISGSGKSSLAYDTLYKEGQRRFIESLSPYARQFLGQMEKPKVDRIEGLSPAVCIDQKRRGFSSRSTVGTITEIYDHLRLLFSRLGTPYCPSCHIEVVTQSIDQITSVVLQDYRGEQALILAPMIVERKGEYRKELAEWKSDGFVRVRVDGKVYRLDEEIPMQRYSKHSLELVIDRIVLDPMNKGRITESIDHALQCAQGKVAIALDSGVYRIFSKERACPQCGFSIPELEPRLFSFNNDQGACSLCQGRGVEERFDPELIVPDPGLSISHGALECIKKDGQLIFSSYGLDHIEGMALYYGISLDLPWKETPENFRNAVLWGTQDYPPLENKKSKKDFPVFPGLIPLMDKVYSQYNLPQYKRFMQISICKECNGMRLKKESLHVLFRGKNIAELSALTTQELHSFFQALSLKEEERLIGKEIFKEIEARLRFLIHVGLPYLTLERRANTLAGGEMQRIRLARQLGANLQGVLYILDEPSIGLHPRDNARLLKALGDLRDSGNTVVVIEHDEETMRAADLIVDIGPGAGSHGGEVVVQGDLDDIQKSQLSPTGRYLSFKEEIPLPSSRRKPSQGWIKLSGISANNLKNIDVEIPLGIFAVVTGVSGSGKSTLVDDVLHKALARELHNSGEIPGKYSQILGIENLDKVIEVDQSPIGRTPRSNPVTYIKVFDEIRNLFALLPEAKVRGYTPGRFSFNVSGGRCEHCQGAGYKEIEMQFLANVLIPCEECNERRFNRETLEIEYKGKNIFDILDMTVAEACEFFTNHPKISPVLETLLDVGMGYIKLGQPSPTLSGGEAQRIKLVRELRRRDTGKTLYILDEPTTGLHFADIKKLLYALNKLVAKGNSVLVIEHNLDVIKVADWIIDLGPEGGEGGGRIVATGTPEMIMACPESYTGIALKSYINHTIAQYSRQKNQKAQSRDMMIYGATKHNLKNITVRIPKEKMTVVTGVSGSGKSSLVFDTLFAEGQRAFLESLSTYARRFLGRLDHGDVESVEGLAPAIAIDQKSISANPRSTVATMTEIYDYLRILYARAGTAHCPECDRPLKAYTPTSASLEIISNPDKGYGLVLAPLYFPGSKKFFTLDSPAALREYAIHLLSKGFTRILIGGEQHRLDELPKDLSKRVPIHLVIDRLQNLEANATRMAEAMENAFSVGHKVAFFYLESKNMLKSFCTLPACVECDYYQEEELHPRMFSFNHYQGACPKCDGLGTLAEYDCPECEGARLKQKYLYIKIQGLSISDFCKLKVDESLEFLENLQLDKNRAVIAQDVVKEIKNRLHFLSDVGLQYLSLERRGNTLSGGEAQRIRLATQIGNRLVGVLYVLDEPTVGLHQRDTERLLTTLRSLVDNGNTVVMVEHDPQCIQSADHILEMGPGAGSQGGKIVVEGTIDDVKNCKLSPTGMYLAKKRKIKTRVALPTSQKHLRIEKACLHNLKEISVSFPLERLTVVTGVSGSGKSSLVVDILQNALTSQQSAFAKDIIQGTPKDGFDRITGLRHLSRLVVVDQTPLSRTPRSNPATYCDIFTPIRNLFASMPGAKARGFNAGRFSFNHPDGRCEVCEGRGLVQIEMHFLSDVWVTCKACQGKRYLEETLAVHYKGKNIAQVLDLDINEAIEFFQAQNAIMKRLRILQDIGLGYLKLGQATSTLSGGEAQRLKLAAELSSPGQGQTLYIMDEPTTGLHASDVQTLLSVLDKLVNAGNSVVVIEHNLDVISSADWVIDLGPEGGEEGGTVVYTGDPKGMLKNKQSHTGKSMQKFFSR